MQIPEPLPFGDLMQNALQILVVESFEHLSSVLCILLGIPMACPDFFQNSSGAFFAPRECAKCKLLSTERTNVRGIDVYFCTNLDANATLEARLISIIHGDTIIVQLGQKEKVRLLGDRCS